MINLKIRKNTFHFLEEIEYGLPTFFSSFNTFFFNEFDAANKREDKSLWSV